MSDSEHIAAFRTTFIWIYPSYYLNSIIHGTIHNELYLLWLFNLQDKFYWLWIRFRICQCLSELMSVWAETEPLHNYMLLYYNVRTIIFSFENPTAYFEPKVLRTQVVSVMCHCNRFDYTLKKNNVNT